MKQVVNFRFSDKTINILLMLENKLHYSKTAIVEKALLMYAEKEFTKQMVLLQYAGALDKNDADNMLTSIKEARHNKDFLDTL